MKSSKEYRAEARTALKGNWGSAIAFAILFGILMSISTASMVGALLLGGALAVGYAFAQIMLFRRGSFSFPDLFIGFHDERFNATIGLGIKKTLLLFAWSLLFVIPGIVKSYSYAMAEFILADHPEMTGIEAITASKKLMNGKKGRLFCLDLSFIGWILLSTLTGGILALWIAPWINATRAAFYESVKTEVTAGPVL